MIRWALRTLFDQPSSLVASITGVGFAFVLALFLEAIYAGEASQMVAYPANAGADVWVMQDGVANMHMASSLIGRAAIEQVRKVPGVEDVTPILYLNTFLRASGRNWFTYVVGIDRDAPRGGPWSLLEGRAPERVGEVVLSDVLAEQARLKLGDIVSLRGRDLVVVGLSRGTWSMANTVTWVSYAELADILAAPRGVSYLLVKAKGGTAPGQLAADLIEQVDGINAVPRDTFIDNDREMAMQMGGMVIRMMMLIGSTIGGLIIAFTVYSAASRRARELAMIKALGARSSRLYGSILLQTGVIAVLGYALALVLVLVGGPTIHEIVPAVTLRFSNTSILRLGVIAFVVAMVASLPPARRVAREDPVSVFAV